MAVVLIHGECENVAGSAARDVERVGVLMLMLIRVFAGVVAGEGVDGDGQRWW
jgi:hypothetical protein